MPLTQLQQSGFRCPACYIYDVVNNNKSLATQMMRFTVCVYRQLTPQSQSQTMLKQTCLLQRRWQTKFANYRALICENIFPSMFAFLALISACCKRDVWQACWCLLVGVQGVRDFKTTNYSAANSSGLSPARVAFRFLARAHRANWTPATCETQPGLLLVEPCYVS